MTHLEPEDILRHALHAAGESVEPAADGLARIRARLTTPRPLIVAWLMAAWASRGRLVGYRLEPALSALAGGLGTALRSGARLVEPTTDRLRPALRFTQPAFERLRPVLGWIAERLRPRAQPEGPSGRLAWVRPAIAMAAVVLVAIVGGFALSGLPHQISQMAQSILPSQTNNSSNGGHGTRVNGSGQRIPAPTADRGASPTPTPTCTPTPRPTPTQTPRPTPTPTPTPTQTSTPTPTPTLGGGTPTPTPTQTNSGGSGTDPSPGAAQSDAASVTAKVVLDGRLARASAKPKPRPTPTC